MDTEGLLDLEMNRARRAGLFHAGSTSWIRCPVRRRRGLPKHWPAASAVRQQRWEALFDCVSALDVERSGFAKESCKEKSRAQYDGGTLCAPCGGRWF